MLLHLLVAVSPFLVVAFPQNDVPVEVTRISQVDGFVFDGPVDAGQRSTSTSTSSSTHTSTSTTSTTALPDTQFNACVTSCPVTNEYNPVCGTDNVDYTNPGGLGCAQRCGKDVTLNYYGRCSTSRTG